MLLRNLQLPESRDILFWEKKYSSQGDYISSEYFGLTRVDYYKVHEDEITLASGWFPFFTSGVYLPIGEPFGNDKDSSDKYMRWALQFEYQNDFSKKDNGFDLSSGQFIIGFGVMWK